MPKNIDGAIGYKLEYLPLTKKLYLGVCSNEFLECDHCDLYDICDDESDERLNDLLDCCLQRYGETLDVIYIKLKRRIDDEEQEVPSLRRTGQRQDR